MKRGSNTFKIAMGGIYLALTIIFLYGASFVPGVELTLFALSSFFAAFMLLETGAGGAFSLFAAACLLGFVLLPDKLAIIPYAGFFGYYGIAKYYIEKINSAPAQIMLKLALFAGTLSIGLIGLGKLLLGVLHLPDYPVFILVAGATLMLFLYDYIYSCIIRIYVTRVQHKGLDDFKLS